MTKRFLFVTVLFLSFQILQAQDFEWAVQMGGVDDDVAKSLAIDESGNVYITGPFSGTADFDPGSGTYYLTSAGDDDIFVSKLDSSDNLLWARQMGGTNYDWANSITTGSSGNVYIAGSFMETADFDPGTDTFNLTSVGRYDIFVCKLDSSGNLLWAKQLGGADSEQPYSITTDVFGNVYTVGYFQGTIDFDPGTGIFNLTSAGDNDIFISKLDTSGNFVWAGQMGGTDDDRALSVAVDSSGNIYTTGYFAGTADFDPGTGIFNFTSAGYDDIFVSKLDSSGDFLWAKQMGGISGDAAYSVIVDNTGNVHTSGFFMGTADFDPGPGTFNLVSEGNNDIFVSRLDTSGSFVWAKQMGGTSEDAATSTAIDVYGNIYTTGYFAGTADFDPGTDTFNLTTVGDKDVFICKLNGSGKFIWAGQMGGSKFEMGLSLTVDISGNVYSTGYFAGTADFDPGADTFNLTSAGEWDIFIQKMNLCLTAGEFDTTACDSYTVPSGDETYTESGTYYDTIPNAAGCDSIITIHLTIDTVDVSVTLEDETLTAHATDAAFQWLDCENDYAIIPGETDSTFKPEVNGTYAVEVTQNNCTDTSTCIPVVNVGMIGVGLDEITIYPNPTDGMIYIDLGSIKGVTIKVFNISGRLVYRKGNIRSKVHQFAFREPPGIYIFEISAQGEKRRFKLVKK